MNGRNLALFLSLLLVLSCGKPTEEERAKKAASDYAKGVELYKKGDYGEAARLLREAEAGMAYLTPEQIRDLKFKLALSLYKAGKYEDAILELEDYVSYYPTAPNVEEAYVYLIRAYLKISPDPWRDQTYAEKALALIEEFLRRFPDSRYLPQLEELKNEALARLARHHLLVAEFYENYGLYYPAALRYEFLLYNFSDLLDERELLFRYVKNLYLVPLYAAKKKGEFLKKAEKLEEQIKEGEVKDKEAAKRRVEFFKEQARRWDRIAAEALKKAEENLKLYERRFGRDKNYEILLKIKKGQREERSWIERIL
ncbi:MAG: outer membrane protein assembly factor BamD [Aquificae bacterium]|nr:outer membrane protein assembly factor BamD [Aquificota bacterium]